MIADIVNKNLKRIENDLNEIKDIQYIDFFDVFPRNEEDKITLDKELESIATILEVTDRGNVYLLNSPIETKYGNLEYIKIRFFDETRLNWEAAADFVVKDRNILLNKVGEDERYTYIKRDKWNAVEFKTKDTLVYFLEPLASEVYGK